MSEPPTGKELSTDILGKEHQLRVHPYHITLIGLFVTAWDDTEAAVYWLLAWLLDDHLRAQAIFYSITDNLARYKFVKTLMESPFTSSVAEQIRKDILGHLKEWKKLSEERNVVIHGRWVRNDQTGEISRQGNVRDPFETFEPQFQKTRVYQIGDLEDLIKKTVSLRETLFPLILPLHHRRLNEKMAASSQSPWPGIPPQQSL